MARLTDRQPDSPAEQAEVYEERVRAVVETALAYWRRGARLQYDSTELALSRSRFGGLGTRRATNYISPEDATWDMPGYTVCSTLPFNLYHDVLGGYMDMDPDYCRCCDHLDLQNIAMVYHWLEGSGESREEAIRIIRQILRPGDLLVAHRETGHALVFLGDCFGDGTDYMLHSRGGKYDLEQGVEKYEQDGTMTLGPADAISFTPDNQEECDRLKSGRWCLYERMHDIAVLRPLRAHRADQFPLTANARARLAHPGLNIERAASVKPYSTLATGGDITYCITVENHSAADYTDILVTERVPAGTVLTGGGGAQVQGNELRWELAIPAGGSAQVSYTVTECGAGEWIVADGGSVAGIRSNCIRTHVGHVLAPGQAQVLKAHAGEGIAQAYRAIGMNVRVETLAEGLLAPIEGQDGLFRIAGEQKMLVPGYLGGRRMITARGEKRIFEFHMDALQVGDIMLYITAPGTPEQQISACLYVGEGRFLRQTDAGMEPVEEDILWPGFIRDIFVCLRPALAAEKE